MGPVEMLKVVLKSAASKPSTRKYPYEKREAFKGSRGRFVIDIDKCNFCTLCQKKCPAGAILVKRAERIYEFDRFRCVVCGACVDACSKNALSLDTAHSIGAVQKGIEIYKGAPLPPQPPKPA
jgi:formate hydrogenlyase subunit 6/NADH:ubiquinone oxidoreductase subunit I